MNTCRFVKDVSEHFQGNAAHYRFDEPILVPENEWDDDTDTVELKDFVVSAIPSAFDTGRPETMIFLADEEGNVRSFRDYAFTQDTDHENCINQLIERFGDG